MNGLLDLIWEKLRKNLKVNKMKHICHICGGDDSKGGCISGSTGFFICKDCIDKKDKVEHHGKR